MTCWRRTFHNPFTEQSFEVTSDEEYLPTLRARIIGEVKGADEEWVDESKYVHQYTLDFKFEGKCPNIVLKEISEPN